MDRPDGPPSAGAVRVTVSSGRHRTDLLLPASVPLVELVPRLAAAVGLLDPGVAHGGYDVLTADGRVLAPGAGLGRQEVEDGAVLTVLAGIERPLPRVHDDPGEAMAEAVGRHVPAWQPVAARRTALTAASVVLGLATAALVADPGPRAAVASSVLAVLALVVAACLSRVAGDPGAAMVVAWWCASAAGAAGWLWTPSGPSSERALATAGAGLLAAAVLSAVALAERRALLIAPAVLGGLASTIGAVLHTTDLPTAETIATTMTLVVMAGSVLPWLALGATGVGPSRSPTRERMDRAAGVGHEVLLAGTVVVGLVVVLAAPWTVTLGLSGSALAVLSSLVLMLRTRQYAAAPTVLAGLVSAVASLVVTVSAVLWWHPDRRAEVAAALVVTGVVVLVVALRAGGPSPRRAWWGDLAETAALVALLPLLVVAVGVLAAVAG